MSAPLSMLIHGESGTGKSWLGGSTPAPRLILDAEGRAHYIPGKKVQWNPLTENPPVPSDEWDTCVVDVRTISTLDRVYSWLASGQHPFKSMTLDSLMEVQKRLIDETAGTEIMKTQDWGTVLRKLESNVRAFRDLATHPDQPLDVVVIICGTIIDDTGMRRPLLQGQLKLTVPYYVDVVGYMFAGVDENGHPARQLLVQPTPQAVAKDGTGRLPLLPVANPNIAALYSIMDTDHTNTEVPA